MAQTDWDFEAANWTIDPAQYVSAPSCVMVANIYAILSRRADCQALAEGRLVTYIRSPHNSCPFILNCRNQAALGLANDSDCYRMTRLTAGGAGGGIVERMEAHTVVWSASFGTLEALSIDTWYKIRFTWWIDWGKIRFRLERWNGSAWVQEGVDCEDPDNKWADAAVNRVGIQGSGYYPWYDDTEIWGPS